MMALAERLANDLKDAMRAGDTARRDVIRLLLAAVKNAELVKNGPLTPEEVAAALTAAGLSLPRDQVHPTLEAAWAVRRGEPAPDELDVRAVTALVAASAAKAAQAGPLTDDEVEVLVRKQAKQRRDSIEAYRAGSRPDLAAREEAELALLGDYLPQPISDEELIALVRTAIDEVGATSLRDMGKVMPVAMARVGGRADGKAVSAAVRALLT